MSGIRCPKCGRDTYIVSTNYVDITNMQWRYRKCKTCGFHFKTVESLVAYDKRRK